MWNQLKSFACKLQAEQVFERNIQKRTKSASYGMYKKITLIDLI